MKNRNGFAHIILLVGLVVIAILFLGSYLFLGTLNPKIAIVELKAAIVELTAKPNEEDSLKTYNNFRVDPTADWKTYNGMTGRGTSYTLKYPQDWTSDEKLGSGEGGCKGPLFLTPNKNTFLKVCEVDNIYGISKTQQSLSSSPDVYSNITPITSQGYNAIKYETHEPSFNQYEYNFESETSVKNQVLWFRYVVELPQRNEDKELFNLILSTFKLNN